MTLLSVVLDIVLVAVLISSALAGWRVGFLTSALGFGTACASLVLGMSLAPRLTVSLDGSDARFPVALVIVIVVVVVGQAIAEAVGLRLLPLARRQPLRFIDSILGVFFRTAVVLAVVSFVITSVRSVSSEGTPLRDTTDASLTRPVIEKLIPQSFRDVVTDFTGRVATFTAEVGGPTGRDPHAAVAAPDTAVTRDPEVRAARTAVVRVGATAPACGRSMEGSGFGYGNGRVVTNAHVVAGSDSIVVTTIDGSTAEAQVVLLDADRDIAVLRIPDVVTGALELPTLELAGAPLKENSDAAVLGYPLNGPYVAMPVRVRDQFILRGPTIYGQGKVERGAYTFRGDIQHGNSGGPLVTLDGTVAGLVFGASVGDNTTGYALTVEEIRGDLKTAEGRTAPLSTGACISDESAENVMRPAR